MVEFLAGNEFRGALLACGTAVSALASLLYFWQAKGRTPLIAMGVHHLGWAVGSLYFSTWNWVGRPDRGEYHLLIPNISVILMLAGTLWLAAWVVQPMRPK